MTISKLENNFLDNVELFTEHNLHHREVLQQLIDETNRLELYDKFEELAFTGKYVNGLIKAIKIGQANPEITNLQQIKSDLISNIEKIIHLIEEITSELNDEVKSELNHKFIETGKEQFNNITQIVDDLDQIKKYLNYLKRK